VVPTKRPARLTFILITALLLAPLAWGQPLPPIPDDDPETLLEQASDDAGRILQIEGQPARPSAIIVHDDTGKELFAYRTSADGTARIVAAGETLVEDATLVAIEGAATDREFTLVLRTPDEDMRLSVYPFVFETAAPVDDLLPEGVSLVLVHDLGLTPRGPRDDGMLAISDLRGSRLTRDSLQASQLNFLNGLSTHTIETQRPASSETYDRVFANISTSPSKFQHATLETRTFNDEVHTMSVTYDPAKSEITRDGQTAHVRLVYENRTLPFMVERYQSATPYEYMVDSQSPTATVSAPATSDTFSFTVNWGGSDALTGIRSYRIQVAPQGGSYVDWAMATKATSAIFSGAWATTYTFRVQAIDGAGNPSGFVSATTRIAAAPAGSDDINDAPTVRLASPQTGDRVKGIATITWTAADPDGTPVMTTVELSPDDGRTWRTLYTGTEQLVVWNTALEADGDNYRLRLTTSDGTLSAVDATGRFSITNLATTGGSSTGSGANSGSSSGSGATAGGSSGTTAPTPSAGADVTPAGDDGESGNAIPGPGLLAVSAGLVGAALLVGQRRRRRD